MLNFEEEVLQQINLNPKASDAQIAKFLCNAYPNHKRVKGKQVDTVRRSVTNARQKNGIPQHLLRLESPSTTIEIDKKQGETDWRTMLQHLKERQSFHQKASFSQDLVNVKIRTKHENIIIQPISDTHIGSIGTDYELFEQFTDYVLATDNMYIILVGDMVDNFVNFRNMLAVHQQILTPEQQDEFLESWLHTIKHKVLFSTWGNHEEFEEKHTGRNMIKRILKHNVAYMNGIGKAILNINDVEYHIGVTHKTRYHSSFNKTHGLKRLAQMDFPEADIIIAGDRHVPDKETIFERGKITVLLQMGTLKLNDGYGKRYFSYLTSGAMPNVVLSTNGKRMTDFWTMEEAIQFAT